MSEGYDNTKKKYAGTWADSMSTGMVRSEGTASPDGAALTMQMVSTDPVTRRATRMQVVTRLESNDRFIDEFYQSNRGSQIKTMEIVYTRKK